MSQKKFFSSVEPALIAFFAAAGGLLVAFFWISHLVATGAAMDADHRLSAMMRNGADSGLAWGPAWFPNIVKDISSMGSMPVLAVLSIGCIVYLAQTERMRKSVFFAATVLTGLVLSQGLKNLYDRPRPDLYAPAVETFTSSFPSAHAMMSATVYLSIGLMMARLHHQRKVKIFFMAFAIILVVLVGLSRVYLAVHWPSDVLAGWTLGALCVLSLRFIERLSLRRMKDRAKRHDPA